MDLIDASNVPTSATVDPITGNTISTNEDANVTVGAQMIDGETLNNGVDGNTEDYIIDNAPTFQDFNTLPPEAKAKIPRLLSSISLFWDIVSPATPFPIQYLPDPECHNWGLSFITSLNRLAELTRSGNKRDAVYYATRHMKERNEIPGNTADEGNLSSKLERETTLITCLKISQSQW
jgi:hypothetical protein